MKIPAWAHKTLAVIGAIAVVWALIYAGFMILLIIALSSGGGFG
jgi:hypothetical protein